MCSTIHSMRNARMEIYARRECSMQQQRDAICGVALDFESTFHVKRNARHDATRYNPDPDTNYTPRKPNRLRIFPQDQRRDGFMYRSKKTHARKP